MRRIGLLVLLLLCSFITISAQEETTENPEDVEESGTYFFKVSAETENGETISKVIAVTLLNYTGEINETNQEGIDARNIRIQTQDVENLDDVEWVVQKSFAYAWSTKTGDRIPIVSVSFTKINNRLYYVDLSTDKGTTKRIKAYITDDSIFTYNNIEEGTRADQEWLRDARELPVLLFIFFALPMVIMFLFSIYFKIHADKAFKMLYEANKETQDS